MPEGDTIFRAARTLNRALAGKTVSGFKTVLPKLSRIDEDHPITGRMIESVESSGKWLSIHFSGDLVLLTHMRMNGSWHIYPAGERWRRPARDMRIVVGTADAVAVAFNVPVAELIARRDLARHKELSALGPDLLAETFDAADAFSRLRARSIDAVGDALLNQRVVAGIGNVYRCEALWSRKINPWKPVSALDDATITGLLETAREAMRANVAGGIHRRFPGYGRGAVHGRGRRPCPRCGTPIRVRAMGEHARLVYWCPACQAG